jgi:hypothetical protein
LSDNDEHTTRSRITRLKSADNFALWEDELQPALLRKRALVFLDKPVNVIQAEEVARLAISSEPNAAEIAKINKAKQDVANLNGDAFGIIIQSLSPEVKAAILFAL